MQKLFNRLDSMAQQYLNEINIYTKKYIDQKYHNQMMKPGSPISAGCPQVYVLDPVQGYKVFCEGRLITLQPVSESEPVKSLHEQVRHLFHEPGRQRFLSQVTKRRRYLYPILTAKL